MTNAHKIFAGKREGNRQTGRLKRRIFEKTYEKMDWIHLAQDTDPYPVLPTR
jgi:hypothetical protein